MKIGIDISQLAYPNTGVSNYVTRLVQELLVKDKENEYILFYSSLRKKLQILHPISNIHSKNVKIKSFKIPPTILDILWNRLHVLPIEWLIGDIDVFITSDWTEPPAVKARKLTILYDLVVYKYPEETARKIIEVQKRKLKWVKRESAIIICISGSTKKDAEGILGIPQDRLRVVYPGL